MPDVAFKKGMTPSLRQQHLPLTESGAKVVHPHRRRRVVKMAGSTNLATMVLSGIHRTTSAKGTTTMSQEHVRTKTTDGRATKAPRMGDPASALAARAAIRSPHRSPPRLRAEPAAAAANGALQHTEAPGQIRTPRARIRPPQGRILTRPARDDRCCHG
jgi:hypothetical protein